MYEPMWFLSNLTSDIFHEKGEISTAEAIGF